MPHERPPQIPEENELPLDIKGSEKFLSPGIETDVYNAEVSKNGTEDAENVMLKEVKRQVFGSMEEAQESKKFYEFLKSFPTFAPFVPDTLYFVARMQEGESAKSYRLQKKIEGRDISSISDQELYADKKLDEELLRCVDGLIDVFERQRNEGGDLPDLYGTKLMTNLLFNPRHTENIVVAEKPDKNDRRVFFVDTAKQSDEKASKLAEWYHKTIGAPAQLFQLKRWREKIAKEIEAK